MKITEAELEFMIFCVENVAIKLDIDAKEVYDKLTSKSNILYEYILPLYDILHTQSKSYIVDDIINTMKQRGVVC